MMRIWSAVVKSYDSFVSFHGLVIVENQIMRSGCSVFP